MDWTIIFWLVLINLIVWIMPDYPTTKYQLNCGKEHNLMIETHGDITMQFGSAGCTMEKLK